MKVLVCFGKFLPILSSTSDVFHLVAQLSGVYASVSLVFLPRDCGVQLPVFDISIHSKTYEEGTINAASNDIPVLFDFLDLCVSEEEYDKIWATCKACVSVKKRYNYRDVFLYNIPFREPVEKALFETPSLFDAQAVILILRECLSPEHPLSPVLLRLHSRTTMPTLLYENLSVFAPCISVCDILETAARQ